MKIKANLYIRKRKAGLQSHYLNLLRRLLGLLLVIFSLLEVVACSSGIGRHLNKIKVRSWRKKSLFLAYNC